MKRLILAFIFCFAVTTVMGQIRLPLVVKAEPPIEGGEETLTAADFTYLGAFRYGTPIWSNGSGVAFRKVGGVNHLLVGQGAGFFWQYGPTEIIDPGTYSKTMATTSIASVYNHWGYTDGAAYDTFHGLYGMTYNASGTLVAMGGNNPYENFLQGSFWTGESATCCLIVSWGAPYGNYDSSWNFVVVDLTNEGSRGPGFTGMSTTAVGPFRSCQGVGLPGGTDEICGVMRAENFTILPDNTFGVTQGTSSTQQGGTMKGPSLFGGLALPNLSTTQGFGTTRAGTGGGGIAGLRSTDLVMPDKYLAHYNLGVTVGAAGVAGTPLYTLRRPPKTSTSYEPYTQYAWEGQDCSDPNTAFAIDYIDPDTNSGVGTMTENDGMGGGIYIPGTKNGFLNIGNFGIGHGWYKTRACLDYYRNAAEAVFNYTDGIANNNSLDFYGNSTYSTLKRVRFTNEGINQTLGIAVSGNDITVRLATNGSGVITSTAAAVRTAVLGDGAAMALLSNVFHGTDGTSGAPYTSDGSSLVTAFGYTKLAGGAQNCRLHNVDLGYAVTGPGTTVARSAFLIYDMADLPSVPDYSPEPEWVWLGDMDSGQVLMSRTPNTFVQEPCGSMTFDPDSRKLYVECGYETTTDASTRKYINVFQIAGEASPAADAAVAARMHENLEVAHMNELLQASVKTLEKGILITFVLGMVIVSVRRKE